MSRTKKSEIVACVMRVLEDFADVSVRVRLEGNMLLVSVDLDGIGDENASTGSSRSVNSLPKPYYDAYGIKLYLGDCFQILPRLPRGSVDLVLVDPPYGMKYKGKRQGRNSVIGDDGSFDTRSSILAALRVLRPSRHFYCFGKADVSGLDVTKPREIIWDKGSHGNGKGTYGTQKEYIQLFKSRHARGKEQLQTAPLTRMRRGDVLAYDRVPKKKMSHPTEKPVDLLRDLIEASSMRGEIVLDYCAGSGSTLIAALLESRRAVGIEIDRAYCDQIATRIDAAARGMGLSSK